MFKISGILLEDFKYRMVILLTLRRQEMGSVDAGLGVLLLGDMEFQLQEPPQQIE
tara:strand:- start:570 stop:734 length:165 start_codon:yes stop_codon:yes gene_type:complete